MTREQLDSALRHAVILGTLSVLLMPAARGSRAACRRFSTKPSISRESRTGTWPTRA